MNGQQVRNVFHELMVNNLFVCDGSDLGENVECLKNEKDQVVFQFKLQEGKTLIESLQEAVNKLKRTVDDAVNDA